MAENYFRPALRSPIEFMYTWDREHPFNPNWPEYTKVEYRTKKKEATKFFRDERAKQEKDLIALGFKFETHFKSKAEAEQYMAKFEGHGLYVMEFSYLF